MDCSTKQPVYLVNTSVTIKGFYDEKNPGNSSLVFTGIDDFLELSGWLPVEQNSKKKTISSEVRGKLRGTMYSALAYLAGMDAYEPNRMLLELVPENERDALSARWLARRWIVWLGSPWGRRLTISTMSIPMGAWCV